MQESISQSKHGQNNIANNGGTGTNYQRKLVYQAVLEEAQAAHDYLEVAHMYVYFLLQERTCQASFTRARGRGEGHA